MTNMDKSYSTKTPAPNGIQIHKFIWSFFSHHQFMSRSREEALRKNVFSTPQHKNVKKFIIFHYKYMIQFSLHSSFPPMQLLWRCILFRQGLLFIGAKMKNRISYSKVVQKSCPVKSQFYNLHTRLCELTIY